MEIGWRSRERHCPPLTRPITSIPSIIILPERRVRRQRQQRSQPQASTTQNIHSSFTIWNTNMHMTAENHLFADQLPISVYQQLIAFLGSNNLLLPTRERVGTRRSNLQASTFRRQNDAITQANQLTLNIRQRMTDRSSNLYL